MKNLLLISNSTQYGEKYLEHCENEIKDFLGSNVKNILFIPYALNDLDSYTNKVRNRFLDFGYNVLSPHENNNSKDALNKVDAIFTGGGNTFRLLTRLYEYDLLESIKNKVENGMPYIGSSAGSNIACPTIKTTNDMPIIYPPSFDALNLVPFNINAHYIDIHPEHHMGETREDRIKEFHELNDKVVIGLREGTMLKINNKSMTLKGIKNCIVFRKDQKPEEFSPNSNLDFLLS